MMSPDEWLMPALWILHVHAMLKSVDSWLILADSDCMLADSSTGSGWCTDDPTLSKVTALSRYFE